jgi:hypothetical protein
VADPSPAPHLTARSPLPNFLVVGAAKSGTTALHHYLRQHPEIFVPTRKEPSHFAAHTNDEGPLPRSWVADWDRYVKLFTDAGDATAIGEVSPAYMLIEGAAQRIHARLPHARMVAVLRDPAERAHSHWLMGRKVGDHDRDFSKTLDHELPWLARGGRSFLRHGFYHRQLAPYVDAFGRDGVHVMRSRDLRTDARGTLAGLYRFLGVTDDVDVTRSDFDNPGGLPRHRVLTHVLRAQKRVVHRLPVTVAAPLKRLNSRLLTSRAQMPALQPEDRSRLVELYAPDICALRDTFDLYIADWLHVGQ